MGWGARQRVRFRPPLCPNGNGTPVIATIDTDSTANATVALAAAETTGVTIAIAPAGAT